MPYPMLYLAVPVVGIIGFFWQTAQARLRNLLQRNPKTVWAVPFLLTAYFAGAALLAGAFSLRLCAMMLVYALVPVACVYSLGAGPAGRPGLRDFAAILLLWLPLEFAAGASMVPRPAQGFLHSAAYGVAILLGLTLFIGFRAFDGMKYERGRGIRDLWLPVTGYAISAPVLMAVGIAIGFIPPPHLATQPAGRMALAVPVIFLGTSLPEEILFRSLIQNLLGLRFGYGWRTLMAASVIFGSAHLDNGPQAVPNWRYMILATIAGVAYGKVFEKSRTVLAPAGLHMMVDWTKHFFF